MGDKDSLALFHPCNGGVQPNINPTRARTEWFIVLIVLAAAAGWVLVVGYACFWYAYLFLNRWPSQETMVRTGYQRIPQARQVDDLFGPAWHQVSNYKEPNVAEWQTRALFVGRYELYMMVNIEVDRRSGHVVKVIGTPRFLLLEVSAVTFAPHGGPSISYQNQVAFGLAKWEKVVAAGGDFSVIGIRLKRNKPIPNFNEYMAYPNSGIQVQARALKGK